MRTRVGKCKFQVAKYISVFSSATCLVSPDSRLSFVRSFPTKCLRRRGVCGCGGRCVVARCVCDTETEDAMRGKSTTACGLGLGCCGGGFPLGRRGLARRRSSGRRPCGCAHFDRVDRHRAAVPGSAMLRPRKPTSPTPRSSAAGMQRPCLALIHTELFTSIGLAARVRVRGK